MEVHRFLRASPESGEQRQNCLPIKPRSFAYMHALSCSRTRINSDHLQETSVVCIKSITVAIKIRWSAVIRRDLAAPALHENPLRSSNCRRSLTISCATSLHVDHVFTISAISTLYIFAAELATIKTVTAVMDTLRL